ncbi:MAG TPA: 2-acyl-glycerophospho-ethanolamine acyltransferase, partial [Verrucomicrobium sp.]|nr:2-acyl-glycerophospho-ethanolamine acyltransferase [Verrucomicrobium sp.]
MSTLHEPPKLKDIVILGQEHVLAGGVLVIPSQLSYFDLLHLEKFFQGRSVVYLSEKGADVVPLIKTHLQGESVRVIEFDSSATEASGFARAVQEETGKGSVVVYVPPTTATQNAALSDIPGARLELLVKTGAPLQPLHILHTNEVALAIESPKPEGDAIFGFGPVLQREDATVAGILESLMELAELCFSRNPILDRNLAYALLQGLKRHG